MKRERGERPHTHTYTRLQKKNRLDTTIASARTHRDFTHTEYYRNGYSAENANQQPTVSFANAVEAILSKRYTTANPT